MVNINNPSGDNMIYVVIIILIVLCVCCIISSVISSFTGMFTNIFKFTNPATPPPSSSVTPPSSSVTPPSLTPKIKFCPQPNLQGACKSYDLAYKIYPMDSSCGSDSIGFKPQSAVIENDDPAKYRLNLTGYFGNAGDTHCGPSQVPLNASPNCYTSNIYGVSNDRGTCLSDTAAGVNWTLNNVGGGINVTR